MKSGSHNTLFTKTPCNRLSTSLTSEHNCPSACLVCCLTDYRCPPFAAKQCCRHHPLRSHTEYDSAHTHTEYHANHAGSRRNQCRAPDHLAPLSRTHYFISMNPRFLLTNSIKQPVLGSRWTVSEGSFIFLPLTPCACSACMYTALKNQSQIHFWAEFVTIITSWKVGSDNANQELSLLANKM
jgi:hypothetical protein